MTGGGDLAGKQKFSFNFTFGFENDENYFNGDFVKIDNKFIRLEDLNFQYDSNDLMKPYEIKTHT